MQTSRKPFVEILKGATTSDQSRPGSNENEGVFHTTPELQNWSFTTKCILVTY